MSLVTSKKIPLRRALQHFVLEDPDEKHYSSKELFGSNGLLIFVVCNHCPYTTVLWERLVEIAEFAYKIDVGVVAINPNIHPNYPEDSPAKMRNKIEEYSLNFPYLIDSKQIVSRSLEAVCTPDIFLFDGKGGLFYHGRLDDNEKDASMVKKEDLRDALVALFTNNPPPKPQHPSHGCSIKWIDTVTG